MLVAMPGELATIVVRADEWFAADVADRHEYEAAAQSRGIVLAKGGGAAGDVLVVIRNGNPSSVTEAVSYNGVVVCSRSPWEHEIRRLLDLGDLCFAGGLPRRASSGSSQTPSGSR